MKNHGVIINFTPTGMIPTKEMTPHVPVSPQEIIKDVLEARKYGVSIVHLHARDKDGVPTYSKEIYKEIIDGIRREDGYDNNSLILGVSTSGRNCPEFEKRSECLELAGKSKPDMASLTLSSLNFNQMASVNSPDMIQKLAQKMKERKIKPELEAFDVGMINYAHYLFKKKLLKPPFYFNLLLGNIACAQANILNLGVMLSELPENSIWSVAGIGDAQLKMNLNGIINGGGIRIGLEDNIWLTPERKSLATNLTLLKRIKDFCDLFEIKIATPSEVRERLDLNIIPQEGL
jgi:uncharacterized protein (DUF849 family)